MPIKSEIEKVLIKGGNSGVAVEMDLVIIHTVLQWFVSEAPKELRTLHNVGRAIRFNDQLIDLLDKESKSSLQYIEKKIVEETGIPDSQYPQKGIVARMAGGIFGYNDYPGVEHD